MVTRAKNGGKQRYNRVRISRAGAKIELLPEGSESQGLPNWREIGINVGGRRKQCWVSVETNEWRVLIRSVDIKVCWRSLSGHVVGQTQVERTSAYTDWEFCEGTGSAKAVLRTTRVSAENTAGEQSQRHSRRRKERRCLYFTFFDVNK
jgi:hypothetical protein